MLGMTRRTPVAAILGLCALLAGCPESVHPVSDPAAAAHDPALFGVWHGVFDGDDMYLHVGAMERGMTGAVTVEHKRKGGDVKVERYTAFPSRLEGLAMLNVRADGGDRGYSLFKYELGKNKLTLWMTSAVAVREDIKAGKLKGSAAEGQFGETRITASSAQIAAWLQAADKKRLFDKPLVFKRLRPR
jgi:hypothetical protein